MKRIAFLFALCAVLSGCGSDIFANLNSAFAKADGAISLVETIISTAQLAFNALKLVVPADKLPVQQTKLDAGIILVRSLETNLRDAKQTALDLQNPHPDFGQLIADLIKAVDDVSGTIAETRSLIPANQQSLLPIPSATQTAKEMELVREVALLHRYTK